MKSIVTVGLAALVLGSTPAGLIAETTSKQAGSAQQQPGSSSQQIGSMQQAAPAQVMASELVVRGKVEDVSKLQKEIEIKAPDGSTINLKVNPEVVDLDKIKKGDNVEVRYIESVALSLQNSGTSTPAPAVAKSVEVMPTGGSTPGAVAVDTAAVIAEVVNVDRQNRTVTLRDPEGDRIMVKAGPDLQGFDQVKVGDRVQVQYTQAMAFEVQQV